jgi:PAS domain S-box-containing protein
LRLIETALEQSNESVIVTTAQLDLPGPQIVYVNSAFTRMTGYEAGEVVGKTPRILQGPKTDRAVLARLREDCAAGRVFHGETVNYRKDGSEFCLEWSVGPVRDDRGKVTSFIATQRDVTERRRVEARLRDNEARLRAVIDNSAAIIFVKDLSGRYLSVNRWYEVLHGMTEAVVRGRTDYELHEKELADISRANDQEVIAADTPLQFEEQLDFPDGRHHFVSVKFPLRGDDGKPYAVCGIATDITERKRMEEALRESQSLNQAVLGSLSAHIAVIDGEGNVIAVNEAWERFAGGTAGWAAGDKIGGKYLTVCRGEEASEGEPQEALAGVREVLGGERPNFMYEYSCDAPGERRWFLMVVTPLAGGRGGAVITHTDITLRKQAEEAIRESEARLWQLADAMPQIVYTCGPDGVADCFNRRWLEYTGIPVGQDFAETWSEIAHPEDRERVCRQWGESIATGEPFEVEYRLRRCDGCYRWQLARATAVRNENGRILKWIGTLTDIHDRKRAEAEREELLARERRARAEAEHGAESIRRLQALVDSALTSLNLDDLLRETLGHVRELLEADSAAILLLTDDGQSLEVRAAIGLDKDVIGLRVPPGRGVAGSIAESRRPLIVEDLSATEVINPVLRRKARSLIGAPLVAKGRLLGVIHADTNQTRRFTEDDVGLMQLAADRVAVAVEHTRLYVVEQQARRNAEDANRMKDEFLALVSHELRSPLNAILGYAALLRQGEPDASRVGHAAEVIERCGKAQSQLIDDLLDTARIISGKLRLAVGPVDLISVIQDSVQAVRPAAVAKDVSLEADLPAEISQITGDSARLQQVVWNLLSNAVKFTAPGGRVQALLRRAGPHIRLTVSDTGKGISPDFLPFVFERFRQADASSARRQGGLGLGLALVKYLVELHGGTVGAASPGEGQGATFTVTLPVRAVASPLGDPPGAPVGGKRSGELRGARVLLVEDEDDARELLTTALTHYGADVVATRSAAEAYAALTESPSRERPDVIVTDIAMQGEDGFGLLRRVRAWEAGRGAPTPAVALTAFGRKEDRVRALRSGFQAHLAKPVEPAELALMLAGLIKREGVGKGRGRFS